MEMQIMLLDQQPNAVAAASANGVNAKQSADTTGGAFKSTFKKVLDDTSANGTPGAEQSEAATVPAGDKAAEGQQELLPACILAAVAMAAPFVTAAVTGETAASMPDDTGQGDTTLSEDFLSVSTSTTPVNTSPLNNPDVIIKPSVPEKENTDMSVGKLSGNSAQANDFQPVMDDNGAINNVPVSQVQKDAANGADTPKVEVTSRRGLVFEQSQPVSQQTKGTSEQVLPASVPVQQAPVPQPENETPAVMPDASDTAADNSPGSAAPINAVGTEAVPDAVKVEPAAVEKDTVQTKKELTTNIAVPVAAATGQQTKSGYDFDNADTFENQSTVTPLAAGHTSQTENADMSFKMPEVPPPVKEQVLQSIVQRAKIMNNGSQQEISLQLKPENLGTLNIQIAMENGAVTAKFQTDNPQVKQALEASFHQLKQDLQGQGFKVQHVAVSIAQQGMSFSEFSRRSPQFGLVKSKRIGKVDEDMIEPAGAVVTTLIENYGELRSKGVDYKV